MKLAQIWLESKSPCADGLEFARSLKFDFAKIYETCNRGDWVIWLLRKSNSIDKPQSVKIAIACAEHVLENFEKKYTKDKRPRKALEAARAWVENPTEENQQAAADAADAADAATGTAATGTAATGTAAAAFAAAAAAFAAYAATAYAADAAADAADAAAADAADAAAFAAAAAAKKTERKWQADKIREIIPNPFL